jgi:hypothetical protein
VLDLRPRAGRGHRGCVIVFWLVIPSSGKSTFSGCVITAALS